MHIKADGIITHDSAEHLLFPLADLLLFQAEMLDDRAGTVHGLQGGNVVEGGIA
jgi:hypothetical protein